MPFAWTRRIALIAIIAGVLASLLIAGDRWRFEARNRTVDISMDQQDLSDFARAYGYDMTELLREMHRAGLTSVAVYEELGQRVNLGDHALALSGQQLIDSARTTPLSDPLLARMVREHQVSADHVYLIIYDAPTLRRYQRALATQLELRNVRLVRGRLPAILAVKTQIDFFNSMGLGIPDDVSLQIRRLGLLVDPRVQNNERLGPPQIAAVFAQMLQGGRVGSVIFFGQRNEVLGFPYNLDATADSFKAANVTFGNIEAYDPNQIQKGSIPLARQIVNQTVRVQAISKIELDKLDVDTVVARYLLGVRERNIRVIYLRPFPHVIQQKQPDGSFVTLSAEATNLAMLQRLREGLAANGFQTGRAQGFVNFKGRALTLLYFIAALGAAGALLLLLDLVGVRRAWFAWVVFGLTTVVFWAGVATGHDVFVRQTLALGAALCFALLAGLTTAPYFRNPDRDAAGRSFVAAYADGLRCLAAALGVAIVGGLFVVGLLSQATFMIEVQQALGTKLLLGAPPLLLLVIYALSSMFGYAQTAGRLAEAPLRVWQFAAVLIVGAAAALLLMRSGNQPDIGVSGFETHVRGVLTTLLGARPRFKEFLIGFPALVLLPALTPAHRRALGWLIVIAAGIALADVIDTFSHIHTPLLITLLRILNGAILGALCGGVLLWLYRTFERRRSVDTGP